MVEYFSEHNFYFLQSIGCFYQLWEMGWSTEEKYELLVATVAVTNKRDVANLVWLV